MERITSETSRRDGLEAPSGRSRSTSVFIASILAFGVVPFAAAVGEPLVKGFPDASLTIYPMTYAITGPKEKHREFYDGMMGPAGQKHFAVIGILDGLLAEQGYDKSEVTDVSFRFAEGLDGRRDRAATFGAFIREHGIATDYALCVDAICHLEESWEEVYAVIVNANGQVVWQDTQRRGDPAFDKHMTGGPEKVCALVCEILTPVIGLDRLSPKELSPEKAQALKRMRAEEPPDREELDAMEKRLAAMKKAGAPATVTVYPTRVQGERTDADSAARVAEALSEAKLCTATAVTEGPLLEGAGWPSEPKVLWLYANAAKDYLREHPANSDYVLFADYWMAPSGEVWAVHFVILDRTGEWVLVDLQNNHHPDFQRLAHTTVEECNQLVVARMKARLR
jgi:hypothetical protein